MQNFMSIVWTCIYYTGKGVYFLLNGVRMPYNNHTSININDIGTGESALLCFTENTNCCGLPNRTGEWYYPDGTLILSASHGFDLFRNRGSQIVRLNRRNNAQSPTGRYCCEVPDADQVMQIICINILNGKYRFI